ncbi:helix-turn-helix transcriptional regulator [Collinsella sp. CLA-ER-H7]|uniref:helix-turn-helix domain-containing protein n=1 Tax=Collinsella sp. CLA-ER-H7 TaxID=3136230 RepID=UPI0032BF8F28
MSLKGIRRKIHLTQEEVATRLNIPKKTYANYERGVRRPPVSMLKQLSDMYDVTIDELISADDEAQDDTARRRIARRLKQLRKERGVSVDELGVAVGKSGKTVSAWEVGHGQPDADAMIKLCRLFGVGIADFYGESGDTMSSDERDLVDVYRSLTTQHKGVLIATANALLAAQNEGADNDQ